MKVVIVLCLLGLTFAAPPPASVTSAGNYNAEILRYDNDNTGFGNYRFAFEQSDGTKHEQQGDLVNEGQEDQYFVIKGRFTYTGPDGVTYTVTYVADQNGYQPEIEQGPGGGVPPAVVASLLG